MKAGALTVSVSTQPTAQTIIAGSSQFEFTRYILDAGSSGEDLKITSLQLYYSTDSANATDLSNCKAYDGATALNTGGNVLNPSSTGSTTLLTFDGSGLTMPKGTSKTLSLKCDIKTGVTNAYWWGIDAGTDITSISGLTSGQTIAETIIDANGQVMTAAANGTYTVSADSSLVYRLAKAAATDVVISKLRFSAGVEEDIDIQQIAFALGSTTINSASDLVSERATIWDGSTKVGDIQFATGGTSPDHATTTLTSAIRIPRGGSKLLTIKGDLRAHDAIYISSTNEPGQFLQIEYDGNNNGLNGNYANGVGSGVTINGSSGDIAPVGVKIFRNYITIEDVTTTTALAEGKLYKIKVTNNGDREVAIGRMSFDVLAQGLASIGDFTLFGPTGRVNATAVATTSQADSTVANGAGQAVGGAGRRLTIDFDDSAEDRLIAGGSSKTYSLQLNGPIDTITAANTESLSIRLLADSTFATTTGSSFSTDPGRVATFASVVGSNPIFGDNTRMGSTSERFVWSPISTTTDPTESFSMLKGRADWTNSYGISGFPSLGSDMDVRVFTH
ncbi:MAG: hypothetical protein HYY92_03750 [Parcubacteria group bacterium]|nr:hypothetical protein [Parcubacteria group bacterium]